MKALTVITLISSMTFTNLTGATNVGEMVSALPVEAVSNQLDLEAILRDYHIIFLRDNETESQEIDEVEDDETEIDIEDYEEDIEDNNEENDESDNEYYNEVHYGRAPIYDGSKYNSSDDTAINSEWFKAERERIDDDDEEFVWGYESDEEVVYDEEIPYDDETSYAEYENQENEEECEEECDKAGNGEIEIPYNDCCEDIMSEGVELNGGI